MDQIESKNILCKDFKDGELKMVDANAFIMSMK